jgi:PAS domain S-box-containing protein
MPGKALILLLEDSSDDAEMVERELRQAGIIFESKRMETEAAFARALLRAEPDLILSDYRLGGFDGLKALAMARRQFPEVPFILMSGVCGEELAIDALTQGASDYVLKDRLYRLAPAVRHALELGERRRADRAARENERKAEEALRASQDRFASFMRHLPGAAWMKDLDGRYVYANEAAERAFRTVLRDLIGRTDADLFPAAMAAQFREKDQMVITGVKSVQKVETFQVEDGFRQVMVRRFPIIGREGSPTMIGGVAFDITEQMKAEAALSESEQRFRLLVDAIPDFIFRLRDDGAVVDFKAPKDADLPAGTSASLGRALAGRALDRIGAPAQRHEALRTGEMHSLEFQFPLRGEARDFEARVTVCGPQELLAIVRDVTERKRLETEVLEVSALERRRIGHNLHDGLGQYLAGIAVKARILADDLAAESSPQRPAARKLVRLINSAIQQTRTLARGLDPVEVEASGFVPALRKLAEETEELFRVPCRFHSSHSAVPLSNTAGVQLFRIAQEAINNAVNHGRAKHIEIDLVLDSGQVRLRIKDDGRGFRIRSTRPAGMGLRIMKYRTHTLAGVLKIDSRPGAGTEIQCVVPVTAAGRFGERPH